MADLKDLFSKFHSNRLKHQRQYEFTIEKYDQILDDSNEVDLENDFKKVHFDDESDETDEDTDNEDIHLEKEYVSNYCNEVKRKMTSTPLYPNTIPLKSTILSGISPFIQSIGKNKKPAPHNILNSVRERNLLKKIDKLQTPRTDQLNQSAILCKPNTENTLHPIPHKLDFDFDLSDQDSDDEKPQSKIPNLFQHKNMSTLSPPSPNDKLKALLDRFAGASKNENQAQENTSLAKKHLDMELSLPQENDQLKEVCVKFSQESSNKNTSQKSPIIGLNKNSSDKKITKCLESDEENEEDDKLGDLVQKCTNNYPRLNFMQSTPVAIQNTQMEKLDFSGLPIATPNDKMKRLSENIADNNEMEINDDENDQVPEMSKKFVNNKKATQTSNSTPKSSLNRSDKSNKKSNEKTKNSCNDPNDHENDHVPEMTAKFKNKKKSSVTESTPNPQSKSYQRHHSCLEDISNLSVRNNGNQIEISVSDSLNDDMPKTLEKNEKLEGSKSNDRLRAYQQNSSTRLFEIFNRKKNVSEKLDNSCIVDENNKEKNKKHDSPQKENRPETKKSPLKKTNADKKSEKRVLNLSNVSMDSNRPDIKKICLEHYHSKVLQNEKTKRSIGKMSILQPSKTLNETKIPDILKICQDKFRQDSIKNDKKTISISKATCKFGREFCRETIQKQSLIS